MRAIVVGSGIAGLTAALRADELGHEVVLVAKGALGDGCTAAAQGGIAGAYGPGDSAELHASDTLRAGAGHGDPAAVAALTAGAGAAIDRLVALGTRFDRDTAGRIARGLEAAHTLPRIAHAGGDATGAEISRALVAELRARPRIAVRTGEMLADLLVDDACIIDGPFPPRVVGISLVSGETIEADAVVLATGGAGRLFARTTNPAGATGDGIAAALRVGARIADLEFVQFHPTVLAEGEPFLLTEALRGAGALLIDADGRRFLADVHPDAELAPRDVVARAVAARAAETGAPVRLDATALGAEALAQRFPTVDRELRRRGIDWAREAVPVTPAEHYLMGGIETDRSGRTSLAGLFAVGETARSGVHGANRLASNSLLEGAVFGARAAEALAGTAWSSSGWPVDAWPEETWSFDGGSGAYLDAEPADASRTAPPSGPAFSRPALQQLMWEHAGLLRSEAGLAEAAQVLDGWAAEAAGTAPASGDVRAQEDANLLLLARATVAAARARTGSLGAHHRLDGGAEALRPAPEPIGAR
ncbi:L-aspartate oxidase [Leucobacter iarius]|uniref:L-aspartate oxidase n=1 Tax=Leucobacter iarius TaxID=333963 RepID=A0ABN2L7P2_9MICO